MNRHDEIERKRKELLHKLLPQAAKVKRNLDERGFPMVHPARELVVDDETKTKADELLIDTIFGLRIRAELTDADFEMIEMWDNDCNPVRMRGMRKYTPEKMQQWFEALDR